MDATIVFDYFKESQGYESLVNEHGFILYRVNGEECHVGHLYIRPYARKLTFAQDLGVKLEETAKAQGCTYLSCLVDLNCAEKDRLLRGYIRYGFNVSDTSNKFLILKKDLT